MEFSIVPATPAHAPVIAKIIGMAVGKDLVEDLAGDDHTADDVEKMFTRLALREDSQYSYKNAMVAMTETGEIAGAVVAYRGDRLYELRPSFFEEAQKWIGLNFEGEIADETDPGEYYLDSLGVFSEYRGSGVGRALIKAVAEKACNENLPVGLLVSKTNRRAAQLYATLGFKQVGERPFAGEMMNHLRQTLSR